MAATKAACQPKVGPRAHEKSDRTARDRLLQAADELFYAEGVHTVGIDRVIERAGVAKASLYGTFGSKDELVRAYLEGRAEDRRVRIGEAMARHESPRGKILSVFDVLAERARDPGFRGCAFLNATAEGPPEACKPRSVALAYRAWIRGLFVTQATELGVADPVRVGRQLNVLYDGALTTASMERDLDAIDDARAMAEALLDTVTPVAMVDSKRVPVSAGSPVGVPHARAPSRTSKRTSPAT